MLQSRAYNLSVDMNLNKIKNLELNNLTCLIKLKLIFIILYSYLDIIRLKQPDNFF